jgi:ABC-2 type transport system permease protein
MPIFDQGYQHWSGHLTGHAWRWLAITRHGVRVGSRNRLLKVLLLASWLPALLLVAIICLWGLLERQSDVLSSIMPYLRFLNPQLLADPRAYRLEVWTVCYDYFLQVELRLCMIVILIVGPSLISQDLRFNALPLYLSRPLRRFDYFLGKLGVIVVFLGRMTLLPCLIAYLLGLLFSADWSVLRETFPLLLASLAYSLLICLSAGMLMLALSALSRNSRYVALFWLGIWFVSSVVASILHNVDAEQRRHAMFREMSVTFPPTTQPLTPAESREREMIRRQARQKAWDRYAAEELKTSATDWRPMVAYTTNLSRVGQHFLGSGSAWQKLSTIQPPAGRERFLFNFQGPQYPWTWSASVLVGLFGLSVVILHTQVKSLDRLK